MAANRPIKRRKPAGERKTSYLRLRMTEAHEEAIKTAAANAGISVSAWALERLLRCAKQEAKEE